ncbi:uncharacterized protein LOC131243363 isoform X1 [Magnolia sinica]|uniref:uncharacterized protein LOC131243363 isoform X1 n=1 Tax=Magnolia sinica TaxID=86752 RepID=UPI00265B2A8E|nr:uncharacterized protein LOC131243363 isoform X1 [Magnolia sinica]
MSEAMGSKRKRGGTVRPSFNDILSSALATRVKVTARRKKIPVPKSEAKEKISTPEAVAAEPLMAKVTAVQVPTSTLAPALAPASTAIAPASTACPSSPPGMRGKFVVVAMPSPHSSDERNPNLHFTTAELVCKIEPLVSNSAMPEAEDRASTAPDLRQPASPAPSQEQESLVQGHHLALLNDWATKHANESAIVSTLNRPLDGVLNDFASYCYTARQSLVLA